MIFRSKNLFQLHIFPNPDSEKKVWIRIQPAIPDERPLLLAYLHIGLAVGELPGHHAGVRDAQPVADLPPQVRVRGAGKYLYVWHSENKAGVTFLSS